MRLMKTVVTTTDCLQEGETDVYLMQFENKRERHRGASPWAHRGADAPAHQPVWVGLCRCEGAWRPLLYPLLC